MSEIRTAADRIGSGLRNIAYDAAFGGGPYDDDVSSGRLPLCQSSFHAYAQLSQ